MHGASPVMNPPREAEAIDVHASTNSGPEAPSYRYRAFISYSTAADGGLAPALQSGLQRFAKPWYWIRAIRVFRDQTGLGVTPSLWGSIDKALRASDYFILLASPGSADSKWVEQEVDWWLQNRSADHLLLVRTEGEIVWDNATQDFDWDRTTALPRRLARAFVHEPRFLDLGWARAKSELSLHHPTFADAVARLASTLRGLPLDELIGEDIRQHRKTVRMLCVAGVALGMVSIVALIAAVQGNRAWRTSTRLVAHEKDASDREVRLSLSRQLATTSLNQLSADRDVSILLASEAVRLHPTPEAESALRRSLTEDLNPTLVLHGHRERECYARFSPDGTQVLTWGDETAQLLDAFTGKLQREFLGHTNDILDAVFRTDGRVVSTASADDSVRLWDVVTGHEERRWQHPGAMSARFGTDGSRLLSLSAGGGALLWDVATRTHIAEMTTIEPLYFSEPLASFHPDGSRIALCGARDPIVIDATTGTIVLELKGHARQARSIQFSPDGNLLVTSSGDSTARIWRVATGQCEQTLNHPIGDSELQEARFSPDGAWVATRDNRATLVLWNAASGQKVAHLESADGPGSPLLFRFSPNGKCLLTATFHSSTAEVWETATGSRLGRLMGNEGEIRTLSFSPTSTRAVVGSIFAPARLYDCRVCGSVDDLLVAARQRVPRELTPEERQQYQAPPTRE